MAVWRLHGSGPYPFAATMEILSRWGSAPWGEIVHGMAEERNGVLAPGMPPLLARAMRKVSGKC